MEGAGHAAIFAFDEDLRAAVGLNFFFVHVNSVGPFEAVGRDLFQRGKVVLLVVLLHVSVVTRVFMAVGVDPLVILAGINEF